MDDREPGGDARYAGDYLLEECAREAAAGRDPVDYAVRAHVVLRGFFGYRYADPVLDAWIGAVDRLLRDHRALATLRRERLSAEELAVWERDEEDVL